MKRISFHLAKINDHTGSIKRKLVLVLSCSERWNGEWIESERHVNRTNEWQHMEKCWKSGKRKGKKKKKNRNCHRSNDCSNVGLNGLLMEFSSDSIELDGARLSVSLCLYSMLHCFRKYLFSPRCRDFSRTMRLRLYVPREHENNCAWRLKTKE